MARSLVVPTLLLTAAIEAVTCLLRFGFQLESTRDTASTIGKLTFGLRVHHGYVGILLLIIATSCCKSVSIKRWLLIVGAALLLSDVVHHFFVLWPLTGSPHFHLVYP